MYLISPCDFVDSFLQRPGKFSAADALIVQLLKGEERVIYTSSNRSIMEKGAISRSCINLSWLKFFRLRKHIFRERDLGAKDRNTVKSSEWSLISASTTPDAKVLVLSLVAARSSGVSVVTVLRVALVIKQWHYDIVVILLIHFY